MLDKAQIDSDLNRLRRLERAHARSQDRLRWQVVSMADQKTGLERQVEVLAEVLPRRHPTTADAFTMTVGAAVFDKRAAAGRALQQRLAGLARDLGYQREAVVPIGTLGGLPIEAVGARSTSGIELVLRCPGVPHTSVEQGVDTLADDSKAVGLVTRLENRINSLEHRRDELHEEAERLGVEIGRAQQRIGAEFPQAGELSAAKLRAADIEARLTEAATPRAATPAQEQVEDRDHSVAGEYSAADLDESHGIDDSEWGHE